VAAPLKDQISVELVESLASSIKLVHTAFDTTSFVDQVSSGLDALEMKDRINLIADTLAGNLPPDYITALAIVVEVAKAETNAWAGWPLCSFVERHGTNDPEPSLGAMPTLTKLWSCEFAIRPFLDQHLDLTLAHLQRWVHDDDEAVRRLPSEGTRPLLPWGPRVHKLTESPQIGVDLVSDLRHDPSEVVRRSVANHLNDIAKFQPDLVVEVLNSWTTEPDPVDDRMVRHALRTLVKQGNPGALALLGFTTDPKISIGHFTCAPTHIDIGSPIELSASLTSTSAQHQKLVVDFVVHHLTASGSVSSKVFKWTTVDLAPGSTVELTKRRMIKQASTRRYHPGVHNVDLQIAGHRVATSHFELNLATDHGEPG